MKKIMSDVKMVYDNHNHSVVVLNYDSEVEVPDQPLVILGMILYERAPLVKEYVFNFSNVNTTLDKTPGFDKKPVLKVIGDIVIIHIPLWFTTNEQDFLQCELVRLLGLRESIKIIDNYTVSINIHNFNTNTIVDFVFQEIQINILIRLLRVFIRRHNVRYKHFEGWFHEEND